MKKIILTIFSVLLFQNFSFAQDYNSYCSSYVPKKNFGGVSSSISGVNLLSRNIIEHQMTKAIKKETNSNFKIDIDNYWGNSLLGGEFKSLSAKTKELPLEGLIFSDVDIYTICPYNRVTLKDNLPVFEENMVLKYSANLTQQNLDKYLLTSEYKKIIDKINSNAVIKNMFQIKNSKISINNNKLNFKYDIAVDLGFIKKTSKISFSSNLAVEEGQIKLCDFELNSLKAGYSSLLPLINNFKPASFDIKIDERNKGRLEVDKIAIKDNKIDFLGYVIIKKSGMQ